VGGSPTGRVRAAAGLRSSRLGFKLVTPERLPPAPTAMVPAAMTPMAIAEARYDSQRVLHRLHSTSSQPRPLGHCPIVADGCAGPP
jgi:hypothetical protein